MTVFMVFAMDVFGPPTELPGVTSDGSNTIEKWFSRDKDRVIKHTFDGFRVRNFNPYRYSKEEIPLDIVPQQRDTFLLRSVILNTNWTNFKSEDSLKKSNTAKMLNKKYNL